MPPAAARHRPRVALASCAQFPDQLDEGPLVLDALDEAGTDAQTAVWSDPSVDWSAFDLVVANGAWDNIHRVTEFLDWVEGLAAAGVRTANAPAILRWNLDKRYLRDLEASRRPDGAHVVGAARRGCGGIRPVGAGSPPGGDRSQAIRVGRRLPDGPLRGARARRGAGAHRRARGSGPDGHGPALPGLRSTPMARPGSSSSEAPSATPSTRTR